MEALMKPLLLAALAATGVAGSAHAQDSALAPSRDVWKDVTAFITAAAEELTPAQYDYRPVASVRTFGQLVAHVAGAQNMFCAAALGDSPRGEDEFEKPGATKAQLVAALKASTEYCTKAYGQADAAVQQPIKLFGQDRTRHYALVMNTTHNGEHYGNIITYMRMLNLVPPSSRR
jgi:uncharacterized damage-inducible protein DinB